MDGLLTIYEVAARLKLNKETIRRKLRSGEMRGYKVRRVWRVKESDLQEFINGGGDAGRATLSQNEK